LKTFLAALLLLAALSIPVSPAAAQDVEPTTFWKRIREKSLYERIWESTRLYENEDNKVIQAFSIIGRYHGQYWSVNADQGAADDWENRRMFVGVEAQLFRDFTAQVQMNIREDLSPVYGGLYQAFAQWEPSDALSASVGRIDYLFTGFERSISSNRIATLERGLLVNQLMPGEVVGVIARGEPGAFSYRAGVFSGSIEDEFTSFAGGMGAMAGVGSSLPLFYEKGSLHLDYLYNDGNASNNALEPYDHVVSLWHHGTIGPFSLGVDVTAGHGIDGRKSVGGVTFLPTYDIGKAMMRKEDALQAVLRYQYAASDGADGLELQQRYEGEVASGAVGDAYHAVYAGLNYLIFQHRFKVMSGAEYSVMNSSTLGRSSYKGWTYSTAVRVFF